MTRSVIYYCLRIRHLRYRSDLQADCTTGIPGLSDSDTGIMIRMWGDGLPRIFEGGDTDLYGYCMNDPMNWIDIIGSEPEIPHRTPTRIAEENDVIVEHYGTEADHGPAHAHVKGGDGPNTKIGPKGHEVRGCPEMSTKQRKVVRKNRKAIRKELNKVGRTFKALDKASKASVIGIIVTILSISTSDDMADAVGDALNPLSVLTGGELSEDDMVYYDK